MVKDYEGIKEKIKDLFNGISDDLESIAEIVENEIPGVKKRIRKWNDFKRWVFDNHEFYRMLLEDKINKEVLCNSERVSASESDYGNLVPKFVEFLEKEGKVEISKVGERVRGDSDHSEYEKVGVFIDGEIAGYLDFYNNEIWYYGKVPGIELKDTIDLNPSNVPGSFIRMIYCLNDDRRDDSWDVPFP